MEVAKITLFNGRVFYTDNLDRDYLRNFFDNVWTKWPDAPKGATNQIDLIEMTPEEYRALGASMETYELFGGAQPTGDEEKAR